MGLAIVEKIIGIRHLGAEGYATGWHRMDGAGVAWNTRPIVDEFN
jgi:hypothetical protein